MRKLSKSLMFTGLLHIVAFAATAQLSTSYRFIREGGGMTYLDPQDPNVKEFTLQGEEMIEKVKLGFSFNFNGELYDSIGISENGYIWFGPAQPEEMININNPITETLPTGVKGVVCAFGLDLHPSINNTIPTTVRVVRNDWVGSPSYFTIEWRNVTRFDALNDQAGPDTLNFQILLFAVEQDRVQITYGQTRLNPTITSDLSVGMRGASSADFAIRMTDATHPWDNTIAGTTINSTCELSAANNPWNAPHNFMSWLRETATGVNDLSAANVSMYPVPANDFLTIVANDQSNEIQSYEIYNMEGKQLVSAPYTGSPISLQQLNEGLYLLKLQTTKGTSSERFVKL